MFKKIEQTYLKPTVVGITSVTCIDICNAIIVSNVEAEPGGWLNVAHAHHSANVSAFETRFYIDGGIA